MFMIPAFICLDKTLHSLICTMNTEVNRIVVWLKSNKITLNTSKPFTWVFTVVEENYTVSLTYLLTMLKSRKLQR